MATVLNSSLPPAAFLSSASVMQLMNSQKDSKWLTLEVCREYQRGNCKRSSEECKYAHPPSGLDIQNGRVTCCFDSIKGKCQRVAPSCKYLHPPTHLKEKLIENGRQNLMQRAQLQASFGSIIQPGYPLSPVAPQMFVDATCQLPSYVPSPAYQPQIVPANETCYTAAAAPASQYAFAGLIAGSQAVPQTVDTSTLIVPTRQQAILGVTIGGRQPVQRVTRPDRVEVCQAFLQGGCPLGPENCLHAHTTENIDLATNNAIVCMDYMNGKCYRETCKYYHPHERLKEFIKRCTNKGGSSRDVGTSSGTGSGGVSGPGLQQGSTSAGGGTTVVTQTIPGSSAAAGGVAEAEQHKHHHQHQLQQQLQQQLLVHGVI